MGKVLIILHLDCEYREVIRQASKEGDLNEHGGNMGKQNRNWMWIGIVAGIVFFGVSAWAQVLPREYYGLRSTNAASNNLTQGPQELVAANTMGLDDGNVSEPTHASVTDVPALNKEVNPTIAPCENPKQVIQVAAGPAPTETAPPSTLTVKASALLELHEMRQSAVNLCLELPAKYRTQLPECADIFKHEIRLKALAKQQQH